tara:strand:+ start:45 stop:476 length:432 start_codon:yes stop_codon:yes gene_type:complete
MNKLFTLLAFLLSASCNGQDYSITDSLTQKIETGTAKFLLIECYCNNGIQIEKTENQLIKIDVKGNLSSEGYHGKQTIPTKIDKETLLFKVEENSDTLRIISKEWTVIHHAYLIEKLKISIPHEMKYEIRKVLGNDLEGREIM